MSISINAEKAFDKILCSFMIKALNKLETYLSKRKVYVKTHILTFQSMVKNLRLFLQYQEQGKDAHFSYFYSIYYQKPQSVQLEKERARRNRYHNWKDRSKIVPVCRHDLIYIENPKGFITTLLEVINSIPLKNTQSEHAKISCVSVH